MRADEEVVVNEADLDTPSGRKLWVDVVFVLLLVAVTTLLLVDFSGLTIRRLGARHAAAAMDFAERRQLFDVQYNHTRYTCKLPFPFWLMSLPVFVLGPTDVVLRLVSELFGLGLVMMAYFLGRKFFGRGAGFFAGVVVVVNVLHPWVVRHSLIDTSAHLLVCLPVAFFYLGWQNPKRRRLYVFLFYAASAIATWHRGPLGFVLPGITVAAVLIPLGQWRVLRQFLNPLAILMWLTLMVPYFLALGREHLSQTILGENLLHFLQGDVSVGEPSEVRPPWYWTAVVLFRTLPWTGFFLLSLVHAVKRRHGPERSVLWFLTAWFGSWFLLWHLSAARNETYVLSLIIPMALLTGTVLDRLWRSPDDVIDTTAKHVWLTFSFVLMGVVSAGMPLAMLVEDGAGLSMIMWGPITAALGLLGLVAVIFSMKRDFRHALVVGICLSVLACALVSFLVRPAGDRMSPGRPLFARVRELVGDRPVLVFGGDDLKQLPHELHSIVLVLRSPHPVTVTGDANKVRKRWKKSDNLVVFLPEVGKGALDKLKLKSRLVRLEDSSGNYLLLFHRKTAQAGKTPSSP